MMRLALIWDAEEQVAELASLLDLDQEQKWKRDSQPRKSLFFKQQQDDEKCDIQKIHYK